VGASTGLYPLNQNSKVRTMKRLPAVLTILGSLTVGLTAGYAASTSQVFQSALRTSLACTLLLEAQAAGYLDGPKRDALIERMAATPTFKAQPAGSAQRLKADCLKG
jgi:hypothetical protein